MVKSLNICILGAGNWGTSLARLLANKGLNVTLWAYEKEVAEGINNSHKNPFFLKDINLPEELRATNDLKEAISGSKFIVSVVPSHALRKVLEDAKDFISKDSIIVSCSKGIEISTCKLVSEIISETLTHIPEGNITYLSGPSFAIEVAKDLPTSVVIAGANDQTTKKVQEVFRTNRFLTFTHNDTIGVEVGGAIKNVLAIASGMSDGLGFGLNARSALITRGLYEMIKIGKALGANPLTFTGLAGMGDLILTATSTTSRNYTLGFRLGKGEKADKILKSTKMVAEGYKTCKAVFELTQKKNIYAPISTEMYNILYNDKSPRQTAEDLTNMELHEELRTILK